MKKQIIEAVRPHRFLYDTHHTDYMKTRMKSDVWSAIAKDINLRDGEEAKALWAKLRSCHRDALRRQRKCAKSGSSGGKTKQWQFQRQMEFLLPFMTNRKRGGNIQDSDDEDQSENADTSENLESGNVESANEENDDVKIEYNDEFDDFIERTEDTIAESSATNKSSKKMRKIGIGGLVQPSTDYHEQRAIERRKSGDSQDPLYHFFMSMYQTVKKMPPASQHYVRTRVFEVVSQTEASLLNISQPPF